MLSHHESGISQKTFFKMKKYVLIWKEVCTLLKIISILDENIFRSQKKTILLT